MIIIQSTAFTENADKKDDELTTRQWINDNLGPETKVLPFSFIYNGLSSDGLLKTWKFGSTSKILDGHRTKTTLTYTDPITALEVQCVFVEYDNFPTVEWTVYFKNNGKTDTPILENIQAVDIHLERESKNKDGEFLLHHSVGAPRKKNDYWPLETLLKPNTKESIGAAEGRPTNSDLSYFNLEWDKQGMIIVIGWLGQWKADFRRDEANGLLVRGGQELTHLILHPGEEIRTPLSVLQFWKGGDWIDAQNVWRKWMIEYNIPRTQGKLPGPILAGATCPFFNFTKSNEDNQKYFIDGCVKKGLPLNCWWIDAGWYPCGNDWHETGSWWPDPNRFPNGLKPISNLAHSHNMKFLLWFEPERVYPDTWLDKNHPEWILRNSNNKNGLLNLGNPEALHWLTNHIDTLITQEGIDIYRQDFNIDPLQFWRDNDTPDREGITEIQYVQGYLEFWDELRHRHPDLLIDACAAGGRRNDLETMRRAVPLWRSDYVYEAVGEQNQTYGISLWLPYNGSGQQLLFKGDKNKVDVYQFRSNLYPSIHAHFDIRREDIDYGDLCRLYGEWRRISKYYFGDYYPLTPLYRQDDLEDYSWIAWQFNRPKEGDGMIQAFRRPHCNYSSGQFPLRGLEPDALYEIQNIDSTKTYHVYGKELMKEGLDINIPNKAGAVVITYKKIQ